LGGAPPNAVGVHTVAVSSIDELLAEARAGLARLEPAHAAAAADEGALLIDTRPVEQRRREGEIPGALVIDRSVLEWRLDPTSPDRIAQVIDHNQIVVVICNEGYSSSLAAATLQHLGLRHATDVIGGFQAWRSCGLPVRHEE
jgi:rhodanese-related sulfurtransferase